MKFVCLGYIKPGTLESLTDSQRNAMVDECFTCDDALRKHGHFAGGEALQPPQSAATLRWENGKAAVTDGPYAETKEQIGGFWFWECASKQEAIAWLKRAPFEHNEVEIREVLETEDFAGPFERAYREAAGAHV